MSASWRDADRPHLDRLRSLEAIRQIASGEVKFPLACGWCDNQGVELEADVAHLVCVACGRRTSLITAHRLRRQKIRTFIAEGATPDALKPPPHR